MYAINYRTHKRIEAPCVRPCARDIENSQPCFILELNELDFPEDREAYYEAKQSQEAAENKEGQVLLWPRSAPKHAY